MKQFSILHLLAGTLLLFTACSGDNKPAVPEFREAAEVLEGARFTDLEGNEVALADYYGKFLVIDFWETWCGPCLQVFPAMQQLKDEYPDEFEMLAVTVGMTDGIQDAIDFKAEEEYTFEYLFDEFDVFEKFQMGAIPFKVYIAPDGEVIKAELGSRGREGDYNHVKGIFLEYREAE